ncbi:hypothetical protein RRG08_015796 [Elysia crispata]|uniref:Uncharacterized protein n=1 Tax=Elysia crispata TaxID=231223 RepID=A0AAE1BA68_9GAST|nr:hypothetical protein RRG08_015796 [Elysia crispata]
MCKISSLFGDQCLLDWTKGHSRNGVISAILRGNVLSGHQPRLANKGTITVNLELLIGNRITHINSGLSSLSDIWSKPTSCLLYRNSSYTQHPVGRQTRQGKAVTMLPTAD